MHGGSERLLQRTDNETAYKSRVPEPHFSLGWMHIHVDDARIAGDEQDEGRMSVRRQVIHIGRSQRALQQPVADRAAVDIEILRQRVGAMVGRQPCETRQANGFALGIDFERIVAEVIAQNLSDARQQSLRANRTGRIFQGCQIVAGQRKAHLRMRHGQALDHIGDRLRFGAIALEEFQACRCRSKEIAHVDARAALMGRRRDRVLAALVDTDHVPVGCGSGPAVDLKMRDRRNGGQGLTTKSERRDVRQVAVGNFRRRMTLHSEIEIARSHAGTVVVDADEPASALFDHHLDAARAGIQRILHEFLYRRRGALDDFARCNAVDEDGIKAANRHPGESLAAGQV